MRLQGAEIKKVEDFKHLGSTVQSNGEYGKEVKKHAQVGWNAWRKVSGVIKELQHKFKDRLETVALRK